MKEEKVAEENAKPKRKCRKSLDKSQKYYDM